MKRLISYLVVSLGMLFANIGIVSATAPRFWKVDIFDPAASTVNRTLNVEYKVFSTYESPKGEHDNDFDVKLLQDGTQVGDIQHISHEMGDSGVFTVNIPATGTYKYKIVVDNNDAAETKESAEKTVQVVDGPAPTVTTVFVNTGGAAGGQAAGGAQAAGAAAAAAPAAEGQVAGATADEGQVSAEASTDEKKEGDVLGASEDTKKSSNNRSRNIAYGVVVAVAVAGGAYYWFLARPRNSA